MAGSESKTIRAQPAQDPLGPRPSILEPSDRRSEPGPSGFRTGGLVVGGITPLTTIDFPGELAAVVYCQGCPWRCRYCQNGHLLERRSQADIAWYDLLAWLERRRGLLDAVVFSGGEPTLHRALPAAIREVRALGFRVGMHTAGCYPDRLDELLPMLDWVGLDIKALPEDYADLTGVPGGGARAFNSLRRLVRGNIRHEVRVTVHDALLTPPKLRRLLALLQDSGAAEVVLQRCRTDRLLDPGLGANIHSWPDKGRCTVDEWRAAAGHRNACRTRHTGTGSTRASQ